MRSAVIAFLMIVAAPAWAEVVECPDGTTWAGADISRCDCCPRCADGRRVADERQCLISPRVVPPDAAQVAGLPRCDDSKLVEAVGTIVTRRDDAAREVFVHPLAWAQMQFELRGNFARWMSACWFSGRGFSIRHAMTGKILATWSALSGYESQE